MELVLGEDGIPRCWWGAGSDYVAYHDEEWGRATTEDSRLFEKICLEGFQSGLSWLTILRKRPAFRRAFDGFSISSVAAYTDADVTRLLGDPGIVRNRAKIEATLCNARAAAALPDGLAALLFGAQLRHRGVAVADLSIELGHELSALVARLLERRDLACLLLLQRRELGCDPRARRVELCKLRDLAGHGRDARRARPVVVIEVDEHPPQFSRALLRQQQLGELLAPRHVARAHLPRQRIPLLVQAAVGARRLALQVAPRFLLGAQVTADLGQLACRSRDLDLGGAQRTRAFVAPRRLARNSLLQLLDLFAYRRKLGFALAPVLSRRELANEQDGRDGDGAESCRPAPSRWLDYSYHGAY